MDIYARSPERKEGYAIHMYSANESMRDSCFSNADGDMLIVPEHGKLQHQPEAMLTPTNERPIGSKCPARII